MYLKQSPKKIFSGLFLLSLYVHCALRHKETRFAWISNVDSRKYQVGYKLQKLSRQVSVLLAGPEKNGFKALVKSQFLTAILSGLRNGLISLFFLANLLILFLISLHTSEFDIWDLNCFIWVLLESPIAENWISYLGSATKLLPLILVFLLFIFVYLLYFLTLFFKHFGSVVPRDKQLNR